MARIPENEIERLKDEVSVERLIEISGIELKKTEYIRDICLSTPVMSSETCQMKLRVWAQNQKYNWQLLVTEYQLTPIPCREKSEPMSA